MTLRTEYHVEGREFAGTVPYRHPNQSPPQRPDSPAGTRPDPLYRTKEANVLVLCPCKELVPRSPGMIYDYKMVSIVGSVRQLAVVAELPAAPDIAKESRYVLQRWTRVITNFSQLPSRLQTQMQFKQAITRESENPTRSRGLSGITLPTKTPPLQQRASEDRFPSAL